MSDLSSRGRAVESQSSHYNVTTSGKLFTHKPLSDSILNVGGDVLLLGR